MRLHRRCLHRARAANERISAPPPPPPPLLLLLLLLLLKSAKPD